MNFTARNVLQVFLASPGDLIEEREIARNVVNRWNQILGKEIGLHVELLGWEDTLPGVGRPQEIINQDVQTCDLFIGLLWKRWGQSTGKFSSGFEEELTIAEERRNKTKSPEIWLFFKKIDKDLLEDPGEQLKLVLDFKQKQVADKKYLFKLFETSVQWKDSLEEILIKYLIRISNTARFALPPSPNESPVPSHETKGPGFIQIADQQTTSKRVPVKLLAALESVIEKVKEGAFGKTNYKSFNEFEISRIFLASSALLSRNYTSESLGVHEVNICYKYRDKYDLVPIEKMLILRTIICSSYENIPGWYWFRDKNKNGICSILRYIALHDNDETFRQKAIEFFTKTNILPHKSKAMARTFYTRILDDSSQTVKKATLQLIGKFGEIRDIGLIEPLLKEPELDLYKDALKCKMEIILREQPDNALTTLLASKLDKRNIEYIYLDNSIASSDDGLLFEYIQDENDKIRTAIIAEMEKRNKIPKDLVQKMLEDPVLDIKYNACMAIIKNGYGITPIRIREIFDKPPESKTVNPGSGLNYLANYFPNKYPPDKIILQLFLTWPLSNLLEEVKWYSINGPIAYEAIAINYYNEDSMDVETDLENDFIKIREKANSEIIQELEEIAQKTILKLKSKVTSDIFEGLKDQAKDSVTEAITARLEGLKKYDDFILSDFTSAALAGIALNGGSKSIEFGRKYINYDDEQIKLQALKIIERFGDESDVNFLVNLAKNSFAEIKIIATRAGLKFSSNYQQAVIPFLESGDIELITKTVKHIWDDDIRKVRPVLEGLLNVNNDKIRKIALSYFMNKLNRHKIEEMLNVYLKQTTYYYNIVHWIDKTIYLPISMRSHFKKEIMNH